MTKLNQHYCKNGSELAKLIRARVKQRNIVVPLPPNRSCIFYPTIIEMIENKVSYLSETGCLIWDGSYSCKTDKQGYGKISNPNIYLGGPFEKANSPALSHRIVWMLVNQIYIPSDIIVLHLCNNRGCVQPHHLMIGSDWENRWHRTLQEEGISMLPNFD